MADIIASRPVVKLATAEMIYDIWIVESLVFSGDGINQPLQAEAWFRIAARTPEGGWAFGDERRNFHIDNVWALAENDASVASTMSGVIANLTRLAVDAGVL
jgi:hypothetical protein